MPEKHTFSVRIDPGRREELDRLAARMDRPRSYLVVQAIHQYLERQAGNLDRDASSATETRRHRILSTLRAHRADLEKRGVLHAALFGSVVRGAEQPDSDVDILVEIDRSKRLGVYGFADLQHHLEDLLRRRVDLVERKALHPTIRDSVLQEAVDAF